MRLKTVGVCNGFAVESDVGLKVTGSTKQVNQDVTDFLFDFEWDPAEVQKDSRFALHYFEPLKDAYCMWHPNTNQKRVLDGCWLLHHYSQLTRSAPVAVIFNAQDMNTVTVSVSEAKRHLEFHLGTDDDKDELRCDVEVPLFQYGTISSASFVVRFDRRKVRYEQTLKAAADWLDEMNGVKPMTVPAQARMPLYSSWYAFHQNTNRKTIEKECRIAAEMGLKSIILDDGWQMDESGCGYLYTGDWEISEKKFPDFKQHVRNVHAIGLKYVLWFSVPLIGQKSKRIHEFRDKLLTSNDSYGTLDPRYPEVRRFLVDLFRKFMKEYDLDGFKLDFIDRFRIYDENIIRPGMDYVCVQEATERLMQDITDSLTAIKPEVLIEFRQPYISPLMRRYGNMLRVGDCSLDAISNRIGVADIRLLTPDRAVHGDMLTWNNVETVENAALQILAVLFGVIQVSKVVSEMTEEHRRMTEFWIGFAMKHEKILQESGFIAEEPDQMYPVLRGFDDDEEIIGVYARNKIVNIAVSRRSTIIVNATQDEHLYLWLEKEQCAEIVVRNTFGEEVSRENRHFTAGVTVHACPKSGLIEMTRNT